MSRFAKGNLRTQEYEEAVKALRKLAEAGGDISAATAEVLVEIHEELLKRDGLKLTTGQHTIWRLPGLTNVPKLHDESYGNPNPPGADHTLLLMKDGKPREFRSEPYSLSYQTLLEMYKFASTHSLQFSISNNRGLHYPGVCLVVSWESADT